MDWFKRFALRFNAVQESLNPGNRRIMKFMVFGAVIFSSILFFAPDLFATILETAGVEYRDVPIVGSRNVIWILAQLHLLSGGFVLGVPVFAWVCEIIGVLTKEDRYIRLSGEFTNLIVAAFGMAAILGTFLLLFLLALYPKLVSYLSDIFWPTYYVYVMLFGVSMIILYQYWSGFETMKDRKGLHLFFGFLLNLVAICVMVVPNSWATFQASPVILSADMGAFEKAWAAVRNPTWIPVNVHRFIANIVLGGFVCGAYAAVRYLGAKTDEERAHYDWMGYIGNFIGMFGLLPLPFAGYWLMREVYMYNQQMGITLMGGFLSWLFILQAVLIGVLFLGTNYYFWVGLAYRTEGGERYRKPMMVMLGALLLCFMVWLTPHSLVASIEEARAMGGTHHPILGVLGVMSAKMTVVNLMILISFASFIMYWRAGKKPKVVWAKAANAFVILLFAVVIVGVVVLGVWGYFVPAIVRINKFSVWQVLSVLFVLVTVTLLTGAMLSGAKLTSKVTWGKMPVRSQHVLVINAITVVFTMGLMGFARSASRIHWHIYAVLEDTSRYAYSPSVGYMGIMAGIATFLFFLMVSFIFWVSIRASEYPAFSTQYFFFAPFFLWIVSKKKTPTVSAVGQVSWWNHSYVKVVGTVCGLLLFFVFIHNAVPQMVSLPPKKVVFDPSQISTKADLVVQGKKIFFGKGKCSLCHSIAPSQSARCPILRGIGGKLRKEFLIDSLLHPKNYVYRDYRGNGSKPFPAQMPVINKPPIGLDMQEILMVVAFLQSLGGEVTVEPEEVKALSPAIVELQEVKAPVPAIFAKGISRAN